MNASAVAQLCARFRAGRKRDKSLVISSHRGGKTPRFGRTCLALVVTGAAVLGCSSEDGDGTDKDGRTTGTGGSAVTGGVPSLGGANGGELPTGRTPAGGFGTGGAPTGGAMTGGATTGGAVTGGASTGGASTGGAPTGGAHTGGAPTGGSGGATTGGAFTGPCGLGIYDPNDPPEVLPISRPPGAHDPSAIEANGRYYLFSTSLFHWTSDNLTSWQNAPRAFGIPSWMSQTISGISDLWAPDIAYFGGQYHLYYSGSTFGSNRSCIGHATSASLDSGSWTDQGSAVICSNVDGTSVNWNAIDPSVVIDAAGNPWMAFGSFWSGIQLIPLDDQGHRVGTEVTNIASRGGPGIEGPAIVYRCGHYYLFSSWDTCCQGAGSTYNIRVVSSEAVSGPYVAKDGTPALDGGGTLIAETGSDFAGPGGQSVLLVGNDAYLVYHAYLRTNGAHQLRIAELVWDFDGWPVPVGP